MYHAFLSAICGCLLGPVQDGRPAAERMPELLEKALAQRSTFSTCRFHLRTERRFQGQPPHVTHYDVNVSHGRLLITELGDDDGVMFREAGSLRPAIGVAAAFHPQTHYMDRKADSYWSHWASAYNAEESMCKRWRAFVDPRSPGMRSIEFQNAGPEEIAAAFRDNPGKTYSVARVNESVERVSARALRNADGAFYEYEWEIDKLKGPAILACREFYTNKEGRRALASEANCRLGEFDGIWWPVEVVRTSVTTGNQVNYTYTQVEFNRPNHPQVLSPESLGLPVGVEVRRHDHQGTFYYVGAGATVDQATWDLMKDAQDLTPLKQFRARMDALGDGQYPDWWHLPDDNLGLPDVADRPDQWEIYVRRWVLKHTPTQGHVVRQPLAGEQRTAAQGILDDCRKQATPIRSRIDKEAARLAAELADVNNQLAKADDKSRAELTKRAGELMAQSGKFKQAPEIERIFESLKKRLDGLLTKEQLAPYVPAKPVPPPPGPRPAGKRPGAAVP